MFGSRFFWDIITLRRELSYCFKVRENLMKEAVSIISSLYIISVIWSLYIISVIWSLYISNMESVYYINNGVCILYK